MRSVTKSHSLIPQPQAACVGERAGVGVYWAPMLFSRSPIAFSALGCALLLPASAVPSLTPTELVNVICFAGCRW